MPSHETTTPSDDMNPTNRLSGTTPEQARVLRFLAQYPKWHTFVELDQLLLLENDDVLCVPSLVKRRWVEHRVSAGCVRITQVGQVIVGEDAESHE